MGNPEAPFPEVSAIFTLPDSPRNKILHSSYPEVTEKAYFMIRYSSIYAVNVGTQKINRRSKNHINRGYLVVLKGEENRIQL